MTDFRALGRRAMAAGFRLTPGVAATTDGGYWGRVSLTVPDRVAMSDGDVRSSAGLVPWFDDPTGCTTGALLTQVREAWDAPFAQVSPALFTSDGEAITGVRWVVYLNHTLDGGLTASGATEAEALVAALEAAKGHECAG